MHKNIKVKSLSKMKKMLHYSKHSIILLKIVYAKVSSTPLIFAMIRH